MKIYTIIPVISIILSLFSFFIERGRFVVGIALGMAITSYIFLEREIKKRKEIMDRDIVENGKEE